MKNFIRNEKLNKFLNNSKLEGIKMLITMVIKLKQFMKGFTLQVISLTIKMKWKTTHLMKKPINLKAATVFGPIRHFFGKQIIWPLVIEKKTTLIIIADN